MLFIISSQSASVFRLQVLSQQPRAELRYAASKREKAFINVALKAEEVGCCA